MKSLMKGKLRLLCLPALAFFLALGMPQASLPQSSQGLREILPEAILPELSVATYAALKKGRQWRYSVVEKRGNQVVNSYEMHRLSLAPATLNGQKVIPVKYNRTDNNLSWIMFYTIDQEKIAVIARQGDSEPQPAKLNFIFLKVPIKTGTSWVSDMGKSAILNVNETVTVPAGTFNCVKIRTKGKYEQTFWDAPNVGNVKQIVEYEDFTRIYELLSFKE